MKESDKDDANLKNDETINKIRKSLLRSTVYSRSSSSQVDYKLPSQNKTTFQKRESTASFERILNSKIKKQEEEERIKMEIKSKKKLLKKVNQAIRKDFLHVFIIFSKF